MAGWKRMTNDEKEQIKALIRSGYTKADISERTGRSTASIQKIRDEMKKSESFDNYHVGGALSKLIPCSTLGEKAEMENTAISEKKLNLQIKNKTVRFEGTQTGLEYIVSSSADELIIRGDVCELSIDFGIIEKFAEEILDIAVEAENLKKQVCV